MLKVVILFGRCKATLYRFANPSSHRHKDNCIHVPRRLGIANARKGDLDAAVNYLYPGAQLLLDEKLRVKWPALGRATAPQFLRLDPNMVHES